MLKVEADLSFLGELVDDLRLEVGAVNARLPEGSGVVVVLPVVVPVPLLVRTVTEHRHLNTDEWSDERQIKQKQS